MSYVTQATLRSKQNIFFIQGQTEIGIDCYYYIMVRPEKVAQFQKIDAGVMVNTDKFGTVLEKGYGEPSETVKQAMFKKYGFT